MVFLSKKTIFWLGYNAEYHWKKKCTFHLICRFVFNWFPDFRTQISKMEWWRLCINNLNSQIFQRVRVHLPSGVHDQSGPASDIHHSGNRTTVLLKSISDPRFTRTMVQMAIGFTDFLFFCASSEVVNTGEEILFRSLYKSQWWVIEMRQNMSDRIKDRQQIVEAK